MVFKIWGEDINPTLVFVVLILILVGGVFIIAWKKEFEERKARIAAAQIESDRRAKFAAERSERRMANILAERRERERKQEERKKMGIQIKKDLSSLKSSVDRINKIKIALNKEREAKEELNVAIAMTLEGISESEAEYVLSILDDKFSRHDIEELALSSELELWESDYDVQEYKYRCLIREFEDKYGKYEFQEVFNESNLFYYDELSIDYDESCYNDLYEPYEEDYSDELCEEDDDRYEPYEEENCDDEEEIDNLKGEYKIGIVEESKFYYEPKVRSSFEKKQEKEILPSSVPDKDISIKTFKYVNFESSNSYKQGSSWRYPMVNFPRYNSIVRSYKYGNTKRRGYKEYYFQETLKSYFSNVFEVSGNVRLNTGKNTRPYEPDIALIDNTSGLNIRIDIEIDEPYAGFSRQATHCVGEDDYRDLYFVDRGWIVIRFTEYQVHCYEKNCIAFIAKVLASINPDYIIPVELKYCALLPEEAQWEVLKAQKWEKERYREKYLGHEFGRVPQVEETRKRELSFQEEQEEKLVIKSSLGKVEYENRLAYNGNNYSSRDARIKFYPENHIYTIDGVVAPSASTIVSKFFPEFDKYYWSERKAPSLGMTPSGVREMWEAKGKDARDKGTFLHQQIENFYLCKDYIETEEFYQFIKFYNDHKQLRPFRTEWRVFDDDYHIAGTIDLLAQNGTSFELYDWKRSEKVVDEFGNPITNNYWQKGIGKLSYIDDTSYNRYCIQQNIYKYIIENNYKIKISRMYLVVFHPQYNSYTKVEVPNCEEEVTYIMQNI